jgi:hypothetical protein
LKNVTDWKSHYSDNLLRKALETSIRSYQTMEAYNVLLTIVIGILVLIGLHCVLCRIAIFLGHVYDYLMSWRWWCSGWWFYFSDRLWHVRPVVPIDRLPATASCGPQLHTVPSSEVTQQFIQQAFARLTPVNPVVPVQPICQTMGPVMMQPIMMQAMVQPIMMQPVTMMAMMQPISLQGLVQPISMQAMVQPISLQAMVQPLSMQGLVQPITPLARVDPVPVAQIVRT